MTRYNFMRLRLIALCLMVASTIAASAAVPAAYYRTCTGKKEGDLKTALHNLLYNHNEVSSYQNLPSYFRITDVYPQGNERYGQWWDMYGNIPLYLPNFWGLNREHSFPKSWWGGSTATPAYVDLNHLYPSESEANKAKRHYPLGTVDMSKNDRSTYDNGVTKVGYPVNGQGGGAKMVFEPADEYKGDFARTYFYMVTCYQNLTWKYTYMVSNNLYPTLNQWSVDLLLKWHRQDPVSQKEYDRNEEVYKIQSNRNPFIDYPELAEYLWGNRKGQPWQPGSGTLPEGDPTLLAPVQGLELQFGETAVGSPNTASVLFQGEYLTNPIELRISLYDYRDTENRDKYQKWASMFTVDTKTVSASAANSKSGVHVRVTYTPTEVGEHLAKLSIEGDPNASSRSVILRGQGLPVPTLSRLTATEASDVTETSYTANWDAPADPDETVDYYLLTRTIINGAASSTETIESETNQMTITGATPGSQEKYSVQSVRLGYKSEPSNEIIVNLATGGIADVELDNPLGWQAIDGGIRLICGQTHTGVRIYDAMGRLIRVLPRVEDGEMISLPMGAFFLTTEQQATPARVVVSH